VAGEGEIGALYLYKPEIEGSDIVFLDRENYTDQTRWEKVVIAYDLNSLPQGTLVALNKGQIVKTREGELYRYLGSDVPDPIVDLTKMDYGNMELWGQLGPNIYDSDVAEDLKAALEGKFYVVKPARVETPTLSLENVGSILLEQRRQILDWIASHGSNEEAVARYQVQLALVEETLVELGLMDVYEDPGTGQRAQTANQGLDVLFVNLPDIYAAPGSVFITADEASRDAYVPLVGNQLVARAGARINVFNETPFFLTVNDAIIRDTKRVAVVNEQYTVLTPGNVYFNNQGLTTISDTARKNIAQPGTRGL